MTLNEAKTRGLHIDPQLRAADWKLNDRTQVRLEVPVDGYDAEPWNGVTDYCLYDASGDVLAVVEAKRCSRNAREADEQLRHYVTEIAKKQPFAPFGFMANGHDIWYWEVGLANPRLVAGFLTPSDLERLKFLRQNRRPIEATSINSSIVERPYQHEAIRRLAEAFAANKRRALLVMATGTGKTRVAFGKLISKGADGNELGMRVLSAVRWRGFRADDPLFVRGISRKSLEKLPAEVRTIAHEMASVSGNPNLYSTDEDERTMSLVQDLERYADGLEMKIKAFRSFLLRHPRHYDMQSVSRRKLLRYVHKTTGQPHYTLVADVLSGAPKVGGEEPIVDVSSLRKVYMISRWAPRKRT